VTEAADDAAGEREQRAPGRLRVLYMCSSLRPGGSERQMLALAQRLPRDRYRVDFLTLSEPGPYAVDAEAFGARVFSLGSSPPPDITPVGRSIHRIRKGLRFLSIVRNGHYDIVDAWMYPTYHLAALTRWLTGPRVVMSGRRDLRGMAQPLGAVGRAIETVARRMTDLVVANSHAVEADTIAREHPKAGHLRVIYNGVEPVPGLSPEEREAHRRAWGVGPDDVLVGAVANYREVKRLDVLVDAFAVAAAKQPGLFLILIGEGPTRPSLEAQVAALGIGERVRLHGAEADPRPLFSAFDIAAHSSMSEGLPNALLEAASAGRPMVATAAGGAAEIVLDGVTGIQVPVGDSAAMAAALERLAADPALRARYGAAARELADHEFGMDRFVAEFGATYEELSAAHGGRAG
jgi:glycosyltransferase involved in cell wall biosynthesis